MKPSIAYGISAIAVLITIVVMFSGVKWGPSEREIFEAGVVQGIFVYEQAKQRAAETNSQSFSDLLETAWQRYLKAQ